MNTQDSSTTEHSSRRAVLLVSLISSFLTPFMVSSVNIALPTIGKALSMGAVSMSWVTASYLLCSTIFLIPFGKIADTYGRKRLFTIGISISIFSALFSALSPNGMWLIISRIIHGIGASMIFGTGIAMLTSSYPAHQRGRILGINVSFVYLGLTLGPSIGGMLTKYLGWRALFIAVIPVGIAVLLLVMYGIHIEWKNDHDAVFDLPGTILYGTALSSLLIGFSKSNSPFGLPLIGIGIISSIFFIVVELHSPAPVLPLKLFSANRLFACSNLTALINYSATYAVGFLVSFYLQYVKSLPPHKAGLLMIIQPVVMVVFSPISGRLSDRIQPRILASIGIACSMIGLLFLSAIRITTPLEIFIAILMLFGFGFALFSSPNTSAVMGSVEKNLYGLASATVGTMRLSGQVLSMGCITLFMSHYIGNTSITPEQYTLFLEVMNRTCKLFAGLCAVGVIVSLTRGVVSPYTSS